MGTTLRSQQENLAKTWSQRLSGQEILHRCAALIDDFISNLFHNCQAVQKAGGEIAIIAVGGYGRQEFFPYSDIDLLVLHDKRAAKHIRNVVESLLYPLWDEGFEVGHSVRTVKDAIKFAKTDFHFQVSLLDARLLAGSAKLFQELQETYKKKVLEGHRHQFVQTMKELIQERWDKYGTHTYLLEPHVKEGKGGMRDLQSMMWVAKAVFGLHDLDALETSGMLEAGNRRSLEESWSMLAKIRNQLHLLSHRKSDHLVFDFQDEVAAALEYKDKDGILGVERFMRDVYSHLQTVSVVTDLFFEHVHEVLGLTSGSATEQQLEQFIVAVRDTIRLTDVTAIETRPYLLMRLFLQSGRTGLPLHHRTRQTISDQLGKVDAHFRSSKRVAHIFLTLLTESKNIFYILETMLSTGLLTRYIPEFAGVESLAQHDLYHLYTVDRHLLQTVTELHKLRQTRAHLFAELNNVSVLFLAGLLHDIGKGKKTDHSALGSEMVMGISKRLHLSDEDCDSLGFIIRYHLYLPENAMRRDFTDNAFVRQAADLIGTIDRLTMLYLLTIADSKATGPSAWSDWKASLLAELYLSLKTCLSANCNVVDQVTRKEERQGVRWLREQIADRLGDMLPAIDIAELPEDYLLSYSLDAVQHHITTYTQQADLLKEKFLLFAERRKRSWPILIMGPDKVGLLAKFCGILALHNLSVLSAQIFTWPESIVVDTLEVVPNNPLSFDEQNWQQVEQDLNRAIAGDLDVGKLLQQKINPQCLWLQQVQQLERKVIIDNTTSQQYTIIEVYGGDNRCALYQLTQTIADFGLAIHRARIATEVEQLIDIFYVCTQTGTKLTDESVKETMTHSLMQIINIERE